MPVSAMNEVGTGPRIKDVQPGVDAESPTVAAVARKPVIRRSIKVGVAARPVKSESGKRKIHPTPQGIHLVEALCLLIVRRACS